jgi:hypothetical protein
MSTPISVTLARVALAEAEVTARAQRRAELIERLSKVRGELHTKSTELELKSRRVFEGQAALENVRGQLMAVLDTLGELEGAKPAVANYLPQDPATIQWQQKHDALVAEHSRLLAVRHGQPDVEVMRFDAVNLIKEVQQLMWSEAEILSQLDGSLARWPSGGVFAP